MHSDVLRNKCQKTSKSSDVILCFFFPARISEWRTKITVTGWFDNGSRVKLGFLLPLPSVPACFDLVLMLYSSWLPARTKKEGKKKLPVSWKHRLERPGVDPNYSWRRSRDGQLNLMRRKKRSWGHTAWCVCVCFESEARWAWRCHHMCPLTHKGFPTVASSLIDSFGWSVFISTELY